MALLEIKLHSETLGLNTCVNVIIPTKRIGSKKLKVLWLLHGYTDDHTGWCRNTSIERYVETKDLCVIMPAVDRSFYTDMVYGNKYFTYVSQELPKVLAEMLSISTKKEDNFVAGLSMGGYGAFKLALNQPERFAAAASLSGALDLHNIFKDTKSQDDDIIYQAKLIFEDYDHFIESSSDLRHMAKLKIDDENLPRLYMCCGQEDFLSEANLAYLRHLEDLGIPVTYEEDKDYAHVWEYWDIKIQRVLTWMGL